MGTQRMHRRDVMYYTVTKKKINKNVEGDTLKTKFKTLPKARVYGRILYEKRRVSSF